MRTSDILTPSTREAYINSPFSPCLRPDVTLRLRLCPCPCKRLVGDGHNPLVAIMIRARVGDIVTSSPRYQASERRTRATIMIHRGWFSVQYLALKEISGQQWPCDEIPHRFCAAVKGSPVLGTPHRTRLVCPLRLPFLHASLHCAKPLPTVLPSPSLGPPRVQLHNKAVWCQIYLSCQLGMTATIALFAICLIARWNRG